MTSHRRRAARLWSHCATGGAVFLLWLLPSARAEGQRVPCAGLNERSGYKILLHDILVESTPADPNFASRLKFALVAALGRLEAGREVPVMLVRCDGSRPGDGDFNRRQMEALNARGAVLEIGGRATDDGAQHYETTILSALVPIQYYEYEAAPPLGLQRISYRLRSTSQIRDFTRQIDSKILEAYALVSVGLKKSKEQKFDVAFGFFCRGLTLLTQIGNDRSPGHLALVDYARGKAGDSLGRARARQQLQLVTNHGICGRP